MMAGCENGNTDKFVNKEKVASSFNYCYLSDQNNTSGLDNLDYMTDTLKFSYADNTLRLLHSMWLNCAMRGSDVYIHTYGTFVHIEERLVGNNSANCMCVSCSDFSIPLSVNKYTFIIKHMHDGIIGRTDTCEINLKKSTEGILILKPKSL